jgi:hypothetical protein
LLAPSVEINCAEVEHEVSEAFPRSIDVAAPL